MILEAYHKDCGSILAISSTVVPAKDAERWVQDTKKRLKGCSRCRMPSSDPRFILLVRPSSSNTSMTLREKLDQIALGDVLRKEAKGAY